MFSPLTRTVLGDVSGAHTQLCPGSGGSGCPVPLHPGKHHHRGVSLRHCGELGHTLSSAKSQPRLTPPPRPFCSRVMSLFLHGLSCLFHLKCHVKHSLCTGVYAMTAVYTRQVPTLAIHQGNVVYVFQCSLAVVARRAARLLCSNHKPRVSRRSLTSNF